MLWSNDNQKKAGKEEAELRAAVLRRLREVIDYSPEAPDMVMPLSGAENNRLEAKRLIV